MVNAEELEWPAQRSQKQQNEEWKRFNCKKSQQPDTLGKDMIRNNPLVTCTILKCNSAWKPFPIETHPQKPLWA